MTNSVADISDEDLLRRAVASARSPFERKGRLHPRWAAVAGVFNLGHTYAGQLCLRFGLNPDEQVNR